MRRLTFIAPLVIAVFSSTSTSPHQSPPSDTRFPSECSGDLVVVQPQPGVPVLISPMRCTRSSTQTADVEFNVVNLSEKAIVSFKVSAKAEHTDYLEPKGDKRSVGGQYPDGKSLSPGWSERVSLGGGILTKSGGIPVGPLTHPTLYVDSVIFADGSQWAEAEK